MLRKRQQISIQLNQLSDAVLLAVVFYAAHALREQMAIWWPLSWPMISPFRYYKWLYLIIIPLCPILLEANGYYNRPLTASARKTLWILLKSIGACALIVVAVMYFMQLTMLARGVILLFAALSVGALWAKDWLARWYFVRIRGGRPENIQQIILVGPRERNKDVLALLQERAPFGYEVVATLNPDSESLTRLPEMLHEYPVSLVIFSVDRTSFAEIEQAVFACETEGVESWLIADFVKTSIARAEIDEFHGKPMLVFRTTPEVSWQLLAKRGIDFVGALVGLFILGPLVMLPVAAAIKLTSPGPILFTQKRSGLHGRRFVMYKFRSMINNAEMLRAELEAFNEVTGPVFKIANDPRLTPIGKFLRRTSIDELPQLWNVLKGDMSLVGPRPLPVYEVERFDPWQRRRLSMKPGLTCLWQIKGRSNLPFSEWMKLDLQYIDNWSLWLDLKILARTVPVVLAGLGAK
jgi:exopolysaccharide biosynthesis polyprenyl glycosylphosphotransferase